MKRSTDGDLTWQAVTGPASHALAATDPNLVYSVAQVLTGTASVQMSLNGGITWSSIGEATMAGLDDSNNAQPLSVVSK